MLNSRCCYLALATIHKVLSTFSMLFVSTLPMNYHQILEVDQDNKDSEHNSTPIYWRVLCTFMSNNWSVPCRV